MNGEKRVTKEPSSAKESFLNTFFQRRNAERQFKKRVIKKTRLKIKMTFLVSREKGIAITDWVINVSAKNIAFFCGYKMLILKISPKLPVMIFSAFSATSQTTNG